MGGGLGDCGLRAARGAVIAFPDDDCAYVKGALRQVLNFFQSYPDAGILSGLAFSGASARGAAAEVRCTSVAIVFMGSLNALVCASAVSADAFWIVLG